MFAITLAAGLPLHAASSIKVAGLELLPKDLLFAAPDPRSRVTGEGSLGEESKWELTAETRLAQRIDAQSCVRYYYKTTGSLVFRPPVPQRPVIRRSERITWTSMQCPDRSGKVTAAKTEARAISSGTNGEGKQQEIVEQPDGTRITIVSDEKGITVAMTYPDGTTDVLNQAAPAP